MPPTTRMNARDEVYTVLKTAWDANPTSQLVTMLYDNVVGELPRDRIPSSATILPWVSVGIVNQSSSLISMGPPGQRLYECAGRLIGLIYTPINDGLTLSDTLYKVILDAFRAYTGTTVRFRDMSASESGRDGAWNVTRVQINFEYDERG